MHWLHHLLALQHLAWQECRHMGVARWVPWSTHMGGLKSFPVLTARGLQGKKSFEFVMVPRRLPPRGRDLCLNFAPFQEKISLDKSWEREEERQRVRWLPRYQRLQGRRPTTTNISDTSTRNRVKRDPHQKKLFRPLFCAVLLSLSDCASFERPSVLISAPQGPMRRD